MRAIIVCAAMLLLLATCPQNASAGAITIVSGEEGPYQVAAEAARHELAAHGHEVRVVLLGEFSKDLAASLAQKADFYVAVGGKSAALLQANVVAKESSKKPPARLLYCMVAGPEALGLTGGAAVGISTDVPLDSQVELILQALPGIHAIGMLYRSNVPESAAIYNQLQQAVPKGVEVVAVAVDKQASVAAAIETLLEKKVGVVWTAADASVYDMAAIKALLLGAMRKQTPVFGFSQPVVKAGGLLGIGIDPAMQGRQVAALLGRLGAEVTAPSPSAPAAAGTPAEAQPTSKPAAATERPVFQIVLNLIVAQRLSIDIPAPLVARATVVFRPEGDKP